MSPTRDPVTEYDLRAPEFRHGAPEDYEFRADGAIVRKDRWERAIRSIASDLELDNWECPQVLEAFATMLQEAQRWRAVAIVAASATGQTDVPSLVDQLSFYPQDDRWVIEGTQKMPVLIKCATLDEAADSLASLYRQSSDDIPF